MEASVSHSLRPPRLALSIIMGLLLGFASIISGPVTSLAADGNEKSSNEQDTYIFLLNSACDWEFQSQFDYYMRMNNTQFEKYIKDYQVSCLGGVMNFSDIESAMLPNLRKSMPYAEFVFVYPDSMLDQYYDYIDRKYGSEYRYLVLGNTDLPSGIAYVNEVPLNVKHELAHLATCGTWHDADGHDIGKIVLHPDAASLPWCHDKD